MPEISWVGFSSLSLAKVLADVRKITPGSNARIMIFSCGYKEITQIRLRDGCLRRGTPSRLLSVSYLHLMRMDYF